MDTQSVGEREWSVFLVSGHCLASQAKKHACLGQSLGDHLAQLYNCFLPSNETEALRGEWLHACPHTARQWQFLGLLSSPRQGNSMEMFPLHLHAHSPGTVRLGFKSQL